MSSVPLSAFDTRGSQQACLLFHPYGGRAGLSITTRSGVYAGRRSARVVPCVPLHARQERQHWIGAQPKLSFTIRSD